MTLKDIINKTFRIILPLSLGILLLWYVYRNQNIGEMMEIIRQGVRYDIILFSLIFGLAGNIFRAYRWSNLIDALGKRIQRSNAIYAVLGNYAINYVLPRLGELWRCGVTAKYEKVPFSKLLGTLFVDRIMDWIVVSVLMFCLYFFNIGFFNKFFADNPPKFIAMINAATHSWWTYIALTAFVSLIWFVLVKYKHVKIVQKARHLLGEVWEGVKSLLKTKHKTLFTVQTIMIWVCYFLYFYITFYAFDFTADLGLRIGLIAFAMSSISVAMPVQGGIGVWHFMVISTFVAFGVSKTDAGAFALIVYTVQTVWLILTGLVGIIALPIVNKTNRQ
ncbi:MAG: flippase-like domain-containing protein [Tannerella sp.]|jgi:uncharacterized membrane protein YbhN (UPF0104 family)|nr:flippase-like domain-containing protein [Tannerella sp.]